MFGYPNTIISDNGPAFIGKAYQSLMKELDILHIASSPHHPKSHGFIERTIRTVKNLMIKSPREAYEALLLHRNTPLGSDLPSPAEILFGHKLQTNLPIQIKSPPNDYFHQKRETDVQVTSERYNKSSKNLPELQLHDKVFYQDVARKTWFPGTISGIGPEPRSYTVTCNNSDRNLRRNRTLLRKQPQISPSTSSQNIEVLPEDLSLILDYDQTSLTPDIQNASNANQQTQSSDNDLYVTRSGRTVKIPCHLIEEI